MLATLTFVFSYGTNWPEWIVGREMRWLEKHAGKTRDATDGRETRWVGGLMLYSNSVG